MQLRWRTFPVHPPESEGKRDLCETADEVQRLFAAELGRQWHFGFEDRPHFVHSDGRQWLVYDELGKWEAWLAHRPVGRFDSLKRARAAVTRARRNEAIPMPWR